MFEFGPERHGVVRLAFNGRCHIEYLAAATEIVVVDQGRAPDPPAANRAEDPGFDNRSLIDRPVLKWFSEVSAWFGGWASRYTLPAPIRATPGGC